MNLSDFDYHLPREMIAQRPLKERDQSKLMVLDRKTKSIEHHRFFELPDLLSPDSVLVLNQSRVIPARLFFKLGNGKAEILLIKQIHGDIWECMVRPGPKFETKAEGQINRDCSFHIKRVTPHGLREIQFYCDDFKAFLKQYGHTPTPPYIKTEVEDPETYQTVYAKTEGSVAAPTAGFHFTPELLGRLKAKGIQTEFLTLHVGLGTFQPVKVDDITEHPMHSEWFELPEDVAERLNQAKTKGKKIVAVGTTSVRVLEACAEGTKTPLPPSQGEPSRLQAQSGETDIFIYPGYEWKFVDQMITNFHVPKSTLLMLVSSFAGREFILKAYEEAKSFAYRFFSFGDSMFIR